MLGLIVERVGAGAGAGSVQEYELSHANAPCRGCRASVAPRHTTAPRTRHLLGLDADLRQRLSAPGRLQDYALARCCRAMVSEAGLNAQGVSTFRRMGTSMSDGWRGSSRAQRVRSQEQAASAWQRESYTIGHADRMALCADHRPARRLYPAGPRLVRCDVSSDAAR